MVIVYEEREALSHAAARLFADQALQRAGERGRFAALLSGGETPQECFELLGREPLRSSVPWDAVHLFWGDERWVPVSDPRSNQGMARRAFIDQVPLSEEQVHGIPFADSPRESAARYDRELRGFFDGEAPRFDLVFLGLGPDGHTASLFPGNAALNERNRWACEVYRSERELYRVTVTAELINQAALVAFLVAGREKAEILARVLEGERELDELPAQLVRPVQGKLLWLVDREAARLLSRHPVLDRSAPEKVIP
ncbi:6-phosphogluconolactonase [Geomonas silvestris]|uniref:6-phosphogluconolactonase n=1 Tax=Geomonas silvestris TaxID=2740184 RepID=A0A6V8MHP5_9BACT|nr:6-phosphogluconolactonase [Geomonas silvestris]GFO59521.1 6-phosphogluconolactonase [Geomonas silvestris]